MHAAPLPNRVTRFTKHTGILMAMVSTASVALADTRTYVIDYQSKSLYALDLETAQTEYIGTHGIDLTCLAYDSFTDTLYGIEFQNEIMYTINRDTGAATSVGRVTDFNANFQGLTFNPADGLLYSSAHIARWWVIDPVNILATHLGYTDGISLSSLDTHPDTGVMYGYTPWTVDFPNRGLYAVNPVTADLTLIGDVHEEFYFNSLAFHPETAELYGVFHDRGDLYRIDHTNGELEYINTIGPEFLNVSGMEITPAITVTEPRPGQVGRTNHIAIRGADANARLVVAYGIQKGRTNVPNCPGVRVDIAHPSVAFVRTDAEGKAMLSAHIPPVLSGRTVYVQAVDPAACEVSNRSQVTFP